MTNLTKTPVLALRRQSMRSRFVPLMLGCLLLQSTVVAADPTAVAAVPEALTTNPVKATSESRYQPMPTQSVAMPAVNNWRDANTRVKELGGWMFYASEADTDPQPAKQPAKPTAEPSSEHQHHHHHPAAKAAVPVKEKP